MIRKVKTRSEWRCVKCCYKDTTDECSSADCSGGYFTDKPSKYKPTRKRKSRDRRLLEALLKDADIFEGSISGMYLRFNTHNYGRKFSDGQMRQLIAIKEAMKGGVK